MRIVFLLTTSLERPYGLGRCFPLVRQMAAAGHEIHLIALHHDWSGAVPRRYRQDGVTVHYVGQMHARKTAGQTTYFGSGQLLRVVVSGTLALARRALAIPADHHIGKPHPQNSLAGWLAAWKHRRPLFLDCDDYEAVANRFSGRWQQQGLIWLEDNLPRRVQGVTANTTFLANRFSGLGVAPERLLHLPNGVDWPRFARIDPLLKARWRHRLEIEDRVVVAYVGTMSLVNHPVDLLLASFVRLARQRPDAVLLLAGDGPDLPALQDLAGRLKIADRCRFTGRVSPEQVPAVLSLAQVTVDPVRDDLVAQARWPLKIMESLALGIPVVTGDVGDRRLMLADGQAGLLVEPGQADALADGLVEALAPGRWSSMRAACLDQAQRYDWNFLADQLLSFYRRTI